MPAQLSHLRRMISPASCQKLAARFVLAALLCSSALAVSPPPRGGGPGVATPSPTRAGTPTPAATPPGALDERLFKSMQWRQVGPFRGGRALAIERVQGEPDTY